MSASGGVARAKRRRKSGARARGAARCARHGRRARGSEEAGAERLSTQQQRLRAHAAGGRDGISMMRSLVTWSTKYRVTVVAVAAALLLVGVRQLRELPVDVLPEFSAPRVEIQTEALGLSAQEVEQLVTLGLEQDLLNGVPWLESLRSESVPGLSSIVLTFRPG